MMKKVAEKAHLRNMIKRSREKEYRCILFLFFIIFSSSLYLWSSLSTFYIEELSLPCDYRNESTLESICRRAEAVQLCLKFDTVFEREIDYIIVKLRIREIVYIIFRLGIFFFFFLLVLFFAFYLWFEHKKR